jgi:hypothetical protein
MISRTTVSGHRVAWLPATVAAGLLAGCSSSAGMKPSTAAARPVSGTPAGPATEAQVRAAYTTFFDSRSNTAQSEAALQHGSAFTATLAAQSRGSYAEKSSAEVTAVRVAGDLANVTFTITSNGATLLTDFKGYAVREGGAWKVAATTFCTLLKLEGDAPGACADPAITALPH